MTAMPDDANIEDNMSRPAAPATAGAVYRKRVGTLVDNIPGQQSSQEARMLYLLMSAQGINSNRLVHFVNANVECGAAFIRDPMNRVNGSVWQLVVAVHRSNIGHDGLVNYADNLWSVTLGQQGVLPSARRMIVRTIAALAK